MRDERGRHVHSYAWDTTRPPFRISCSPFRELILALSFFTWYPGPAAAQDAGRFVRWSYGDAYHILRHDMPAVLLLGVAGGGLVAAGMQVDEDLQREVRKAFDGEELYLDVTNELGNPLILAAPVALFGTALTIGDAKLQDAAFTSVQSVFYAGAITQFLKSAIGRHRPEAGDGARQFDPYSGNTSLPSGHATIAFAMLTPWIYYYPHPITYGLFTLGAGTALSRIALDQHWPTDVLIGGGIGFLMARSLSKRHLSETRRTSSVSITPLLSPRVAGLHLTVSLASRTARPSAPRSASR